MTKKSEKTAEETPKKEEKDKKEKTDSSKTTVKDEAGKTDVNPSAKLDLSELWKEVQKDIKLPIFVGIMANSGNQGTYETEVEKMKNGEELTKFMSLDEFKKAKEEFLNKKI